MGSRGPREAERERFGRFLAGEMGDAERAAYAADPGAERGLGADLRRVARLIEVDRGGGTPGEARAHAGLSVGQAAKLLGWERSRLEAVEAGAPLGEDDRAALARLYEVGGFRDASRGGRA